MRESLTGEPLDDQGYPLRVDEEYKVHTLEGDEIVSMEALYQGQRGEDCIFVECLNRKLHRVPTSALLGCWPRRADRLGRHQADRIAL